MQCNPICTAYPICQEMLLLLSSEYNQNATFSFLQKTCCLCLDTICYYLDFCNNLTGLSSSASFIPSHSFTRYLPCAYEYAIVFLGTSVPAVNNSNNVPDLTYWQLTLYLINRGSFVSPLPYFIYVGGTLHHMSIILFPITRT